MKIVLSIIALLIFSATVSQLYQLEAKKNQLTGSLNVARQKSEALASENKSLEDDIRYYSDDKNLEKEARAQFNYAKPGEKLIIVVPKKQPANNE